ncbi:MAG TPA: DUF3303 family protein [Ktedonobacterales bacterium]|nr:DUF3303 family protein [Ktedonobacterales bacterium]
MLWYCSYTWHPTTNVRDVRGRILQQDEVGSNIPGKIKGWYDLAGGGAGFVLLETDDIEEVNAFCQPYMDLMSWDVRAIRPLEYRASLERFRKEF